MDRNRAYTMTITICIALSLSARRAWIEILASRLTDMSDAVALRKESVDRNPPVDTSSVKVSASLSARRAWIEIRQLIRHRSKYRRRSPQGERG